MLTLAAILLAAGPGLAQDSSTAAVVGAVRVTRLDVFDPSAPGEDRWIYRAANKLHIVTREEAVRREILLKPGDPFDPLKAVESERNLRGTGFYRRAEVRAVPGGPGLLDLDVLTQDSWTTQAQLSIGTEGGQHFVIYGLTELNILGTNKSLSFIHSQVGPKIRDNMFFRDPRLLGSRFQLGLLYGTIVHGESKAFTLKRPFFSLETPYALHASGARLVSEHVVYEDSLERQHFLIDARAVQAGAGARLPWGGSFTHRAHALWSFSEDRFSRLEDTRGLPADRRLSGPALGYSWVRPRYARETYIDRMERTEDYNLGNELQLQVGRMGRDLGSDRDRLTFSLSDQQGVSLGEGRFLLGSAGFTGRAAGRGLENALVFANLNLFWKSDGPLVPQTRIAHLEFTQGLNLDGENQILLGGNNGLRGYRNFSFAGERSFLANLENRLFIPREFLHLLRVGGAVFLDAGAVVPETGALALGRLKTDVGLGLRFSPTRSTTGRVLRIDLAYALNPGPGPNRLILAAKGGQAFSIFSSSSRHTRQNPSPRLEEGVFRDGQAGH